MAFVLGLGLQAVGSQSMLVLDTKLKCSAGAASALNCRAISPAQPVCFISAGITGVCHHSWPPLMSSFQAF